MADQEKIEAVRGYLSREFPGSVIEDRYDPGRKLHVFQVAGGKAPHVVLVSDAFLGMCEASEMAATLTVMTVAEHLREMGATPIVVTPEGLKLEGD